MRSHVVHMKATLQGTYFRVNSDQSMTGIATKLTAARAPAVLSSRLLSWARSFRTELRTGGTSFLVTAREWALLILVGKQDGVEKAAPSEMIAAIVEILNIDIAEFLCVRRPGPATPACPSGDQTRTAAMICNFHGHQIRALMVVERRFARLGFRRLA